MLRHTRILRNHDADPSKPLRMALLTWAVVLGAGSAVTDSPVNAILFNLAAWLPASILLLPLLAIGITRPWRLMGAGIACFILAASIESVARFRGGVVPERGSLGDVAFVAGYVLFGAGVWFLVATHARRALREGIADLLILLIPATVLLLEFVIIPGSDASDPWGLRFLAGLFTLADVVLVAALLWLISTPTLRGRHLGTLLAGVILTLVADVILAADLLHPSSTERAAVEAIYPYTWALMAVGVALGSRSPTVEEPTTSFVHWGRVTLLGFGVVLMPISFALAAAGPNPLATEGIAIAAVLSSTLIVMRTLDLALGQERTAIKLDSARRQLREAATHDPLTGLLNRSVLTNLLTSGEPIHEPIALVSLDLDGFKEINDTFGHAAGDHVLQTVAKRMTEAMRPGDEVLRMGGDEFLIIAPGVNRSEVAQLTERLLRHIERPISWTGDDDGTRPLEVSASAGIAFTGETASESTQVSTSIDQALSSSDEAMYLAKDRGPGLVVLHHEKDPDQA